MADIGTAYFRVAPNMSGVQSKIASGLRGSGSQFGDQFGKELGTRSSVIFGAIAGITQVATQKAIALISSSVSDAVKRVDILNNFPKVMSNMGISFEDAAKASDKLDKGLRGLPTTLDTGTLAVQRLTTKTQDVGRATDIFLAFNNAVLAGGAPMELQATATEQFAQAFAKGKPDMMEWRSMLAAMPAQLQQVAAAMDLPSADALGQGLRDGSISMDQFAKALTNLNKKGVNGLPNLAEQAKNATGGIQTSMAVMRTAIARGLAGIMKSIGTANIANALTTVGKAFETVFKGIASAISFVAAHKDIFAPIAVGITAIVTAMTVWAAITKTVAIAQAILNAVLTANPIGVIILAVIGLVAALTFFFTKTKTGKAIMEGFFKVVTAVWNGIKTGIQAVGNFFKSNFEIIKKVMIGIAAVILLPFLPLIALVALVVKNFTTIKNTIITVMRAIWSVISPILNFIKNLFIIVFGAIAIVVLTQLTIVKNIVLAVFNVLKGIFITVLNAIKTVVLFYFNVYKTIITTVFNAVASFVSAVWNKIFGVISGIVKKLIAFFAPAFSWLYSKGKAIVQGLVSGISSMAGAVWNAIKSVADRIGKFFAGAGKWLYDVGKSIVQGLINGIKSMVGAVADTAGNIGNAVKDKVKGLLGIHSPSTVFAQIGVDIGRGMAKGIEGSAGMVTKSVDNMTNGILSAATDPAFSPTVAFAGSRVATPGAGGANNTNQSVTIGTIVLGDASAVKEMFRQLNQDTMNLGMGLTPVQGAQR